MRWSGLIVLAVLAGLYFVAAWFFSDSWVETRLENNASSANGALVEIDNLHYSIFDATVGWDRLQVTDPYNTMTNAIETGKTHMDLDFWPLFWSRVIVENAEILDIQINTPRKSDGALPKEEQPTQPEEPGYFSELMQDLQERAKQEVNTELDMAGAQINADSIMSRVNLQSIDKINALQQELDSTYKFWDNQLKTLNIEAETKAIENNIKKIKIDKKNSLKEWQQSLAAANAVSKSLNTLNSTYKNTKQNLQNDLNRGKTLYSNVNQWVKDDYQKVMRMANITDMSAGNIGELLFGRDVYARFASYLGYVGQARDMLSGSDSDTTRKEEDPPRYDGQDIRFPLYTPQPDYWVKNAKISGTTPDSIYLSGNIRHIVSDQRIIGQPTTFDMQGQGKNNAALTINGEFNYLGELPTEVVNATYRGISLRNTKITDSDLIPNKLANGTGAIRAALTMKGDQILSDIGFIGSDITYVTDKVPTNRWKKLFYEAVTDLNTLTVDVQLKGTAANYAMSLNSNLDQALAAALKKSVNKEIEKAKKKLTDRVDKEVAKYRSKLDGFVQGKEKAIRDQLKKYDKEIAKYTKMADDKTKKIEEEIKNKGTKKLKDLLKF
jgi:uncharacterized protein (TIGR03545 family)